MSKEIERIKDLKDIFNKKLEHFELDKKLGQLSIDSIYSLFPTDIELLLNYINQLEKENEELKSKVKYWVDMYEDLKKKTEKAIRMLEINIELVKQLPSKEPLEDAFIIERYNGLLSILRSENNE